MQRGVIILICTVCGLAALAADIKIEIRGIKGANGNILLSLFSSPKGFPAEHKEAIHKRIVKIETNAVSAVIKNIDPGKYALAVCHDENSDSKMNRNYLGMPKEGYAVYKLQKSRPGPPLFKKSAFKLSTNDLNIAVILEYPGD